MSSPEAMLSGTEAEERELASSLDRLPEPPSLSLAEVRQLNAAFNGLRECGEWRECVDDRERERNTQLLAQMTKEWCTASQEFA